MGGHGKALMFAHVSPVESSAQETLSTLNFAVRTSSVGQGLGLGGGGGADSVDPYLLKAPTTPVFNGLKAPTTPGIFKV